MENKIECLECHKFYENITYHVKVHKLTAKTYGIKYPYAKLVSEQYIEKHRQNSLLRYSGEDKEYYIKQAGKTVFDFVKNDELKSLLRRDLSSAKTCLKNKLWKPSIILYGSILEALLIEETKKDTFVKAVENAFEINLITEKEYHKIHIVRDLRNFVHLHKELSEKEEINEYWAKTFADMCDAIIKRLNSVPKI